MKDRQHQAELRLKLKGAYNPSSLKILAWVVPGGGKSHLPGILAERFPNHKLAWFVPRLSLRKQGAQSLQKHFDIQIRESDNEVNPSRGSRGFITTQQGLARAPDLWRDELSRTPYILIFDEIHHAKLDAKNDDEARAIARALKQLDAPIHLHMTGTLRTHDRAPIYGIEYDANGDPHVEKSADIVIRYDRKTALKEKAIVPIEFALYDGDMAWEDAETKVGSECRLSEATEENRRQALRTMLQTAAATQLFTSGVQHWQEYGKNVGGKLIVCVSNQAAAVQYCELLKSQYGISAALAIDDNARAHAELDGFKNHLPAMVTCQMAYEGLDVPSASHLILLTHIRSSPWLEQLFGRIWRACNGNKKKCWAFVPDDPQLKMCIQIIQDEQASVVSMTEGERNDPLPPPSRDLPLFIPIDGELDMQRASWLDGDLSSEECDRLVEVVRLAGMDGTEPEVLALQQAIRNKRSKVPVAVKATIAEEEARLRLSISDECRRINNQLGLPWGTTEGWLIRKTGKSTTEMSIQELKHALSILAGYNPRRGNR